MTKGSTVAVFEQAITREVIGFDLSDKSGTYTVLDVMGKLGAEGKVVLSQEGLAKFFGAREPARIAIEAGTHSPWVSRALAGLGHEVIVANPRQVRLISRSKKKNDREDARLLARLARFDPELLHPVRHRGEQAQADLALLRSRDCLVRSRTALVNHVRGEVKTAGGRLEQCSTKSFAAKARDQIPPMLQAGLLPMLDLIDHTSQQIAEHTKKLEQVAAERYPETQLLRRIKGVGPLTSLAFVLTLEEPQRFAKSRSVGAFVGLTRRQADSGESEPQLHITKAGDPLLRRLLVQSAHYILGRYGPDCDLRRWGLKLAGEGNKIRKRKAVVAVARKLAVLLHHLWANGVAYEPLWSELKAKQEAI